MSALSTILARYTNIPADLRAQLSAELAGMERDAGRYVSARNADPDDEVPHITVHMQTEWGKWHHKWMYGAACDDAIDAAMTKEK